MTVKKPPGPSRDNPVSVVTRLQAGQPQNRVRLPAGARGLFTLQKSTPAVGSRQPPIQWAPGSPSSGVKRLGRKADLSLSSSTEGN